MPPDPAPHPSYAAVFQCLGAQCEDDCCHGWDIPVDRSTYSRYQEFPPEPLGQIVSEFISITPSAPDPLYATIHRLPSDQCAFFGSDRLCRIQKNYGAALLSSSCSIYPRHLSQVGQHLEGTLSLSCPQAARQVLLDPEFLFRAGDLYSGSFRTDNRFYPQGADVEVQHLLEVRARLLHIVHDRSLPLERRLLRIGAICQQLESSDEHTQGAAECGEAVCATMGTNLAGRLDLVLKLTADRIADRTCSPRFSQLYWDLIEVIGTQETDSPGADLRSFLRADSTSLQPCLDEYPYIFENYLSNYILQHLFPFGRKGSPHFTARTPMQEFLLLATQYTWLRGLLAGAVGPHKQSSAQDAIVAAVQVFTRAVENFPAILQATLNEAEARGFTTLPAWSAIFF